MGDLGGFLGSMFGAALGPLGSVGGAFAGDAIEKAVSGNKSQTPTYPEPVDYSDAMAYASDNNKTTALAQIQSQEFQIHQAATDREMQQTAGSELAFEKLGTKLQVSKLDYFKQMTAEENRHVEKIATYQHKFGSQEGHGDLPPPDEIV